MIYCVQEWQAIKEAVDTQRADNEDEDSKQILAQYFLWDWFSDSIDEDAVNTLYRDYT
jgi:hypothetical protein